MNKILPEAAPTLSRRHCAKPSFGYPGVATVSSDVGNIYYNVIFTTILVAMKECILKASRPGRNSAIRSADLTPRSQRRI